METQQDPETTNFSHQCLPRATWNTNEIEVSTSSVKIQQEGSWKGTRRGKICLLKVCKTDCFVSGLVAYSSTLNGHRANKNGYLLSVLVHRLSDLCRTNVFALCDLWHIDFLELWSPWTGFSRIPHFLPVWGVQEPLRKFWAGRNCTPLVVVSQCCPVCEENR